MPKNPEMDFLEDVQSRNIPSNHALQHFLLFAKYIFQYILIIMATSESSSSYYTSSEEEVLEPAPAPAREPDLVTQ